MNSITFKGVNSSSIDGLIIQSLPSITKPPMRTAVTQVDGRDGDIVDELGYGSYEKDVVIGMKRGADIDAIADFFSGSGPLILSNEPTRQYNVDIYNQVDFEQLFRFRTGTVKYIAQPYKYLVGETATTLNITSQNHINVNSVGLQPSKPLIRLQGSGTVTLTVASLEVLTITIDDGYVLLDSDSEDAYITGELKNTNMTGDFIVLQPGTNVIGWSGTGTLTRIEVSPRSRWL